VPAKEAVFGIRAADGFVNDFFAGIPISLERLRVPNCPLLQC